MVCVAKHKGCRRDDHYDDDVESTHDNDRLASADVLFMRLLSGKEVLNSRGQLRPLTRTVPFLCSMITLLTISCPLFMLSSSLHHHNVSFSQHKVSTWFANARRRLKKENKMTWEPRNKTNDSCHDDDEGDDDKESLNGSEDNLSSSGGIGDNSTTTSILTPLGSASSGHHIHHHSMQANAGNGGSSGAVNQMNNSLHGTVQSHHQSHQQQYHLLQPLHHRTTASSSSSPPPSPRSLDKNDSLLMDGRTTTTSDNSCDKNLRNNNIKALNSQGNCPVFVIFPYDLSCLTFQSESTDKGRHVLLVS